MANDLVRNALGKRFSFTITNASAGVLVVALLAAIFDTLSVTAETDAATHVTTITKNYADPTELVAAGIACDAVLDDGIIKTNLTATSGNSEMTIRQFREYVKTSGGLILQNMFVQANNVAAFNECIKVIKYTPLGGSAPDYLYLTDFKSVDQSANDKINIRNINLEMDFDTVMTMKVNPGHTVTITFLF
jgi:hypothetical protein